MTVYDLLKHYVGGKVELSNGEDVQMINVGLAIELYNDTVVDYFYVTDDDMGSYITIMTKEE